MEYLRIPAERVAVLIGEGGATKRLIEARTRTSLTVEDTAVSIEGESFDCYLAKDVVRAIGRGFSPENALRLLSEGQTLEVIELDGFAGNQRAFPRLRSRVIGENGKSRRVIEELTGTHVSVFGKTVSIIGDFDDVELAREAVAKLLSGAPHSHVYRFLEKAHSQRR